MTDLVWHYTDTAGLVGIVTAHKLRATSVSFLNDPEETRYAADVMRQVTEGLEDVDRGESRGYFEHALLRDGDFGYDERFVACASGSMDGLEMWRAYGAGAVQGTFAIGLDPSEPLGVLVGNTPEPQVRAVENPPGWQKVKYDWKNDAADRLAQELRRQVQQVVATIYDQDDPESDSHHRQLHVWRVIDAAWKDLLATGKHPAFAVEDEFRLNCHIQTPAPVQLHPSIRGPIPFVELTASGGWSQPAREVRRLPIREVIAWPGAPQSALKGVAAALTKGGYLHNRQDSVYFIDESAAPVKLRTSAVPFV